MMKVLLKIVCNKKILFKKILLYMTEKIHLVIILIYNTTTLLNPTNLILKKSTI